MTPVRSVDPRTGEPFGNPWQDTTSEQLDAVCDAAARAAGTLRRTTGDQRAGWLDAVGDALEAARAELVALADRESGLGEVRLNGELTRTIFQLRFLGEAARSGEHLGVTVSPATDSPMGPLPDLRRTAVPIGPVAVFAASNFPFAFSVAGGDSASALAAGCPVVVKIHPSHPALSMAVAEIVRSALASAGAPEGSFAAVTGMDTGAELVRHPAIRAVAFTGSLQGGRALLELTNARPDPIPFYGELGSLNPLIVTPAAARARGESIGRGWIGSLTLGGGQFCTKPGLLLVPAGAASVVEAATEEIEGAPTPVLLNGSIRDRYESGVRELESMATPLATSASRDGGGFAVRPVIVRATVAEALASPGMLEEVFGPAGVVLEYSSVDEVEALLDHVAGSLTVTVHGEDDDADASTMVALATGVGGRVIWNGYPTGVAVSASMHHGGPWPSSTSARDTSVGSAAIARFVRPVSYQSLPAHLLPAELRD
jgi:NADP-dependent aldehyde dehydrogenase